MSSRDERLRWEQEQLDRYVESCPLVDTEGHRLVEITDRRGDPPNWYLFTYRCRGLVCDPQTQRIGIAINHQVEFRLGEDYPFSPPTIRAVTPVYHPNIGDGVNGGYVCLAGDYSPGITLAELVRQVGEMIRLAKYWEVPSTRPVYKDLQRDPALLPVDRRPFPAPPVAYPPLVERGLRVEVPQQGVVLQVTKMGNRTLSEIASLVAQDRKLPLQTADGRPIRYELKRKGEVDREGVFVLEAVVEELAVPRESEANFVLRFLVQVKAANPGVFDFIPEPSSSEQEHLYRLIFNLETFAPAIAAGGKQVYVRTKYNEAHLRVPVDPSNGQLSVIWLTPIFHPYLEKGAQIQVPARKPREPEVVTLFQMFSQLLAYRPVAGLEVKNQQALDWVRFNEARVEWLRQNNPLFNLPEES